MKPVFLFILGILIMTNSFAQKNTLNRETLFVSAGRIAFGTGDFFGYGVNVGYARRLNTRKKFLNHFDEQIELSFEDGNQQPKVINPTLDEFFHHAYYSTANIAIVPKIGCYPFNKTFLKGINVSAGFSFGYTNQSREFEATRIYDTVSQIAVRRSYLEYIDQFIFGYRISAGYEHPVSKHISAGARMDLENYTNLGDINTTLVLKIGYVF